MDFLSLSLGSVVGALAGRAMSRTREHRGAAQGVADLLNWAFMVDDGVILQKDGSLLAGWRYQGPDVSAATAQELDNLSRHVNDALLPLTDEWMLHVDAIRRPATAYSGSGFPDAITQLIDDERRAAYDKNASRQFETEYFLVLTRSTPSETFSRLRIAFVQGLDRSTVDWGKVLGGFETALSALEDRLSAHLALRRLDSADILRHLTEDGIWSIYFNTVLLATVDERDDIIRG
jgi:type IV secretory pathway VirB4 component